MLMSCYVSVFMANLELNDEQLKIIDRACELFSRIYMGQLEEVAWLFNCSSHSQQQYIELKESLTRLNFIITGMPNQSHFGIANENVPDIARCAYDIHQVIRHYLAWKENPQGGFGVSFDSPSQYAKQALPKIT